MREVMLDNFIIEYRKYYEMATYKTIYHTLEFLIAEEAAEDYPTYLYIYEEKEEFVILPSIKRKINDLGIYNCIDEIYYDIKTPHEYSGVIASRNDGELLRRFYIELDKFCRSNNIIFSFIRFNPYTDEYKYAQDFQISKPHEQVWIDLTAEDIWEECSYSYRRKIRAAEKEKLIFECDKGKSALFNYMHIYKESMNALKAKPFFHFNELYFERLFNYDMVQAYFVYNEDKSAVLAALLELSDLYNGVAYYHLGCRNREIIEKGSYEFLLTKCAENAKKNNILKYHLGGAPTASLLDFKSRFSKNRIDFFVGHKIFDEKVYAQLIAIFDNKNPQFKESDYKPKYRAV